MLFLFLSVSLLTTPLAVAKEHVLRFALYADIQDKKNRFDLTLREQPFLEKGYQIEYITLPARRMAPELKLSNIASFPGAPDIHGIVYDDLLRSKYPVHTYQISIYFNHSPDWRPSWPANPAFLSAPGVTQTFTNLREIGFNITKHTNLRASIKMVTAGRTQYWIGAINPSDPAFKQMLSTAAGDDFGIEELFLSPVYLWFADTPRGHTLKEILDRGVENFFSNSLNYSQLLEQSEFPDGANFNQYYRYMASHYPEIMPNGAGGK